MYNVILTLNRARRRVVEDKPVRERQAQPGVHQPHTTWRGSLLHRACRRRLLNAFLCHYRHEINSWATLPLFRYLLYCIKSPHFRPLTFSAASVPLVGVSFST